MSGLYDCCIDTSNVVTIDINPLPTGAITNIADTTICGGSQVLLKVHLTGAPNWTIVYLEGSTPVTVNGISAADYTISRIPAPTSFMTTFIYSLSSVTDNNGCIAASPGGTKKANVYRVPNANAGPDDGICGPKYTLAAVASDGIGTWFFPSQVLSFTVNDPHTKIEIDSSFTTASVKYKFYWEEKNWLCTDKDSVEITFYNRIDTIDAGTGGPIFTFDNITQVNAYPIQSYETGKWSVVAGTGDFENDAATTTYVKNISIGTDTYRWTVTYGECILTDDVTYEVSNPVIPEGISPNGDLKNDTLRIDGLDFINQIVELSILNGAGSLVFSTSNKNGEKWISWDGKNSKGKELPEGTYYYLLKVTSPKAGHVAKKSGFIILKRRQDS
jgi:gliding motility-associated-like protein